MSWQGARKDAQQWLDTLQLPTNKLKGQTIDLTEQAKALRGEPRYVAMILKAAKRLLFKRGVIAVFENPNPVAKLLENLGDEDAADR